MQLWSLMRCRIIGRFLSSSRNTVVRHIVSERESVGLAGAGGGAFEHTKQERKRKASAKHMYMYSYTHTSLRGVKSPTLGLMPKSQC